MGAMSRNKGSTWEREVARRLREVFGGGVGRGIGQTRGGSAEAPDVDGVPGWWVECKHGKQPNLRAALEQARTAEEVWRSHHTAATTRRRPVAFVKDDRRAPMVLLSMEDFIDLLRERQESSPPPLPAPPPNVKLERLPGGKVQVTFDLAVLPPAL